MTAAAPNPSANPGAPTQWPAFRAGPRVFSIDDILTAAAWRGDLANFRSAWNERLLRAAGAHSAGLTPEPDDVEAATDAFRYARDLVSAEECERWLAQRGLVFDDLADSMTRRLQAELGDENQPSRQMEPDDDQDTDEIEERFRIDALLADEFTDWAHQLAWRIALACEDHAMPSVDTALASVWQELEERFAAVSSTLTTPESRKRELAAQRLQLMHVEVVAAEFDNEAAAREAYLCSREDGMALAEVAAANGFPCHTYQSFLGDLPADWQQVLVSATPGDVTPPLTSDGNVVVLRLLAKREPSVDDETVCNRLNQDLRRQRFGELEAKHVRWLINVEVES